MKDKYIGNKYGKWTIISRVLPKRPQKYLARCDCGEESVVFLGNLTRGSSRNCTKCQSKKKGEIHIGKKYGYLTILDNPKINGKIRYKCLCDCGNEVIIRQLGKGNRHKACGKCHLTNNKSKKINDKIGKKFGYLKIISYDFLKKIYTCLCDCGQICHLKKHKITIDKPSCGCYWKKAREENAKKLEGMKYYYLKILKFLGMDETKRAKYLVKCKCGNKFERSIKHLFGSKSCGCYQKEKVVKGSQSWNAKTNEIDVSSIRDLYSSGYYSKKDLSDIFGLKYSHIHSLIINKSWTHISKTNIK